MFRSTQKLVYDCVRAGAQIERSTVARGSFGPASKTKDMLPREYTREALKGGLAYEARLGVNAFRLGMIGSTDSHISLATAEESNFFGKAAMSEPSSDPIRFEEVIAGRTARKGA